MPKPSTFATGKTDMNETKEKILTGAKKLFLRLGLRNVTLDDICRELGISKKTLYLHFEDKNDLVRQIFEQLLQHKEREINEIIQERNLDPISQFTAILNCSTPELRSIHPATIHELRKYHPDAWKVFDHHKNEFILETTRANIEFGIKEGVYRSDINPEIIARIYQNTIEALTDSSNFSTEIPIHELFSQFIKYHFHGITTEKGQKLLKQIEIFPS